MLKRRGEEAVKSDAQFDKASSTGVRVRDRPESRDEAPSLGEQLRLEVSGVEEPPLRHRRGVRREQRRGAEGVPVLMHHVKQT